MKRQIIISKYIISFFLTIIGLLWIFLNREKIFFVFNFNPIQFSILLSLAFISFLIIASINQLFLSFFNIHLKPREWISIFFASSFANLFLPLKGGAFLKATYLKKKYTFSYSNFISTQTAYILISITSNCITALVATYILYLKGIPPPYQLILFLFFLTFICVLIFKVKYNYIREESSYNLLFRILTNISHGLTLINSDKKIIIKVFLFTIFIIILSSLRLYVSFLSIGYSTPFLYSILLSTLANISTLLSITPSGLGIKEGTIIWIGSTLGIPLEISTLAALMDRSVGIILIISIGYISFINLNRKA